MIDTNNLPALPAGWVWTRLEEVANIISGQTPKNLKELCEKGNIPFYKVSDMNKPGNEKFMIDSEISITENDAEHIKIHIHHPGTVIFPKRGGAIATNKKRILSKRSAYDLNIMGVYPLIIPYTYFYYWISSVNLITLSDGSNVPQINHKDINPLKFPLPPLQEQHRIVTKIEELFTKLDAGMDALKKVKSQLKRYRQSVLNHAFCGKLTEEWRKSHKDELEPASVLLERIREEKEKKGKSKKDTGEINSEGLQELPVGWEWVYLPALGQLSRGMSKHRPRDDKKLFGGLYPFIQTGEIRNSNGLIISYKQTYNDVGLKQSKLWPINTLCITIAANIADTAILGIPACFPDSIVGFIANENICNIKYVHYFIKKIKNKLDSFASATAQKNINVNILNKVKIPLPSLPEQHRIVEEIERRFSIAEEVEKTVDHSLKQAGKLRQSILKSAFSGRLVHQNPSDEPAEELLKRIKEERERNSGCENSKKTGKKKLPSH